MADRRLPSYPPVGSDDRLDRIMDRGRSLRRRRQLGLGAGAGGAVAAVALAAVLVVGGGGGDDPEGLVADAPDDTSTTTTSTTAVPEPEGMTVSVVESGGSERIVVEDPAQPGGELSVQCVQVTLRPADAPDGAVAVAEGYGCDDMPAVDGGVPVTLLPTDGVEIGCAATVTSEPAATGPPTAVTTTFALDAASVPPGEYLMEVGATSGIGDGCAGTDDDAPGGTEHSATTSARLSLG